MTSFATRDDFLRDLLTRIELKAKARRTQLPIQTLRDIQELVDEGIRVLNGDIHDRQHPQTRNDKASSKTRRV